MKFDIKLERPLDTSDKMLLKENRPKDVYNLRFTDKAALDAKYLAWLGVDVKSFLSHILNIHAQEAREKGAQPVCPPAKKDKGTDPSLGQ